MGGFVIAGRVDEFEGGSMEAIDVRGTRIAVAYVNGTFHAFGDTCTHRGCSLAEGDLEETTVICPCHGSEFDVRNGAVIRGPAREPVETYETRVEGDNLEIES